MVGKANKYAKGQGSVYQRKSDGLWVASLTLPSHTEKRRRKTVTAKTEGKAKEKLKEMRRELLIGGDLATSAQTLSSWLDVWLREIVAKENRPKTAAGYKTSVNQYIKPAIGKVRLDKLTTAHVRALEAFITAPPPNGKGLSSSSASQAYRALSVALKYAQREGRVTRNVAQLANAPRVKRSELAVLSPADGMRVLKEASTMRNGSRWAAALFTGARQGELLGLEIDRVSDVLELSWQLQRITWEHGCGGTCGKKQGAGCPQRKLDLPADYEHRHLRGGLWLVRPKSSSGWRVIPLVSPLREIIQRQKEYVAAHPNKYGLLWTDEKGNPIDPSRDNKGWHDLLKNVGVDDARVHDIRHTTASLLLAANVPAPVVTKILGHSTYATSQGYMHVDRGQLDSAMGAIAALISDD